MCTTSDGGYIIGNGKAIYKNYVIDTAGHTTSAQVSRASIVRLDSNFNVVWMIDTGVWGECYFRAIAKTTSGDYVAVGTAFELKAFGMIHHDGRIMKFREDGTILWDHHYRSSTSDYDRNTIHSVSFLSNGDIVTAGETADNARNSPLPGQQTWVMHLDSNGCIPDSADCGFAPLHTSTAIDEPARDQGSVKVYPNPATHYLSIELSSAVRKSSRVVFYDLLGRVIATQHLESSTTIIDCLGWDRGLYLWQVLHSDQTIATGKVVVE